ncbi:MAG TPA: hypothetical protein PKD09_09350 [Aggregatilinea sp.]|uniref:hypothetical protein n=1 Tax=Aggregatilinea sp. TaxID=2806333 RepID=UPI002C576CAE|nr:hypothetical protein [Aggregatilinea sp.]HML21842.1 hypothetical protein [Aggregatilinea sp.]
MAVTVRQLHERAMALADDALIARTRGEMSRVKRLSRRAFRLERRAAQSVPLAPESEPTRSILYRSAAWLALDSGAPEDALEMVKFGLAGDPPILVRRELFDARRHARAALKPSEEPPF